mgnify:CR=1 FL=1
MIRKSGEFDMCLDLKESLIPNGIKPKKTEELIRRVHARYSKEFLEAVTVKDKKEYFADTVNALRELYNDRDPDFRGNLTISLMNMIDDHYKNVKLTTATQLFLTAVIHICFINVKEIGDEFTKLFCTFNVKYGPISTFCRFVVISEIEYYCYFECHKVKAWHQEVIQHDGEVIAAVPIESGEVFSLSRIIWETYGAIQTKELKVLKCFTSKGKTGDITKSPYWYFRQERLMKKRKDFKDE